MNHLKFFLHKNTFVYLNINFRGTFVQQKLLLFNHSQRILAILMAEVRISVTRSCDHAMVRWKEMRCPAAPCATSM